MSKLMGWMAFLLLLLIILLRYIGLKCSKC